MNGRRALVTGAGGIGVATAAELAARGAAVVLLDSDKSAAVRGAESARVAGVVEADVRDADAVASAVTRASEILGGTVDLLVTTAGIYRVCPALELDPEEWEEVLGVNLRGTWLVSREVARRLLSERHGGSIVTLSSTAALVADAVEPAAHYSASKAGVIALTRQLAVEWAPHIRVNAVCPGFIDTPMLRMMDDPEKGQAVLDTAVPLGRLGRPEDVARTVVFLASDDAAYVTGVALAVDGGATAL